MRIRRVLMCRPTYFDIEYSINPWMDTNNRVNKEKAAAQWEYVYQILKDADVEIVELEPVPGLPDMTFIGDAGMVHNGKFIPSNFRHVERQGEVEHYVRCLSGLGLSVHKIPEHIFFEGLGDIIYYGDDVIFGFGPRSSPESIDYVKRVYPELNVRGELQLQDESLYHAGLAIALIDKDTLLYYPEAFTEESRQFITQNFERAIPVSESDAKQYFVCNNIPLGKRLLMDNCSSDLEARLRDWGYEVVKTDMSEFKKSGGSVRCLILNL